MQHTRCYQLEEGRVTRGGSADVSGYKWKVLVIWCLVERVIFWDVMIFSSVVVDDEHFFFLHAKLYGYRIVSDQLFGKRETRKAGKIAYSQDVYHRSRVGSLVLCKLLIMPLSNLMSIVLAIHLKRSLTS